MAGLPILLALWARSIFSEIVAEVIFDKRLKTNYVLFSKCPISYRVSYVNRTFTNKNPEIKLIDYRVLQTRLIFVYRIIERERQKKCLFDLFQTHSFFFLFFKGFSNLLFATIFIFNSQANLAYSFQKNHVPANR